MEHTDPHLLLIDGGPDRGKRVCGCGCDDCTTDTTDADGLDFVTCICPDCDIEACGLHAETTTPGGNL